MKVPYGVMRPHHVIRPKCGEALFQIFHNTISKLRIHLLGFKPIHRLRPYHHIRAPQFIYPDESYIRGSRLWFTTLLQVCLNRRLFAMALYVQRKNIPPRLIALIPQVVEDIHES
ncbi:hypothetical protein X801_09183 [Opisthorchis viverrini]|uniref:Ku domain-containing protein n=1 Tax=Opisthorchis viverrini TaxID=6198 RepID=A0A1S8WKQ8_OPIVI|nr:hypothetical protein X801_09183 [Opisthorchis viverrini]